MAIEESKISNLIATYKKYEQKCWGSGELINKARAGVYRAVIEDLESLLPRKTIADLGVSDYGDLTGTIVEYAGMKGVILCASVDMVMLFTFADTCVVYADPTLVYPLDEERIWDETGVIL